MENVVLSSESKNLFERMCSSAALHEAFIAVKRNKGACGVDGVSIDAFEANLGQELTKLQQEVVTWSYVPQPVRRVEIPKPGPGAGVRMLGIPCIRDRVLQTAMKSALEPILDPLFSENSYGFRPGRSQRQAVEAAQKIVQSGKKYVVDIDLAKFFDKIHHDRLVHRLSLIICDKRILRLVGMTLRSGVMQNGLVSETTEGSVQGSPLSPLLSNLVLDELDKELESRGLEFCRFADDCNIFVGSQNAAERVMKSVTKFIEDRLKLEVNQTKSKVAESKYVKFLGMTIVDGDIAISRQSISRAMTRVKELTPRGTHYPIEQSVKRINQWYVGWSNYYKMTQYPAQLAAIEAHIRRRLRSRFVSQQKRRRYLVNKLVKLGWPHKQARKTVYSNRGRWALSHTKAVEKAYPNKWFTDRLGLKVRSDRKAENEHWHDIKRWIKLA